jgi:hypothetical protein
VQWCKLITTGFHIVNGVNGFDDKVEAQEDTRGGVESDQR